MHDDCLVHNINNSNCVNFLCVCQCSTGIFLILLTSYFSSRESKASVDIEFNVIQCVLCIILSVAVQYRHYLTIHPLTVVCTDETHFRTFRVCNCAAFNVHILLFIYNCRCLCIELYLLFSCREICNLVSSWCYFVLNQHVITFTVTNSHNSPSTMTAWTSCYQIRLGNQSFSFKSSFTINLLFTINECIVFNA